MFLLTGKKTKDGHLKKFKMNEQNLFGFFLSHMESCRIDQNKKQKEYDKNDKILFLFFSKTPVWPSISISWDLFCSHCISNKRLTVILFI